jgi:hypothetical protein
LAADPDPCAGFTWDVTHERALFNEAPQRVVAAASAQEPPPLATHRLYELSLRPQSQVHFTVAPGKNPSIEGYAGIATLRLSAPGAYRIALDQSVWVDVVAQGALIRSRDFQGRAGCMAPHKIVEFLLPAQTPLTLQFSAARGSTLKVAVLPAPTP